MHHVFRLILVWSHLLKHTTTLQAYYNLLAKKLLRKHVILICTAITEVNIKDYVVLWKFHVEIEVFQEVTNKTLLYRIYQIYVF